ncbi:hypothetical protein BC831DRAFT_514700, partial [Entophlyctis helioformis]
MTFVALNKLPPAEALGQSVISRELLVENTLGQYLRALELQRKHDHVSATAVYAELVCMPIMLEPLAPVADIQGSPIHALQFAVHKNYALSLLQRVACVGDDAAGAADAADLTSDMPPFDKADAANRAVSHLRKALAIDASDYECNHTLADLSLKHGDHNQAYACLHSCVVNAPAQPQRLKSLEMLAKLLFDLGEYSECLQVLDRILQLAPAHPDANAIKDTILLESLEGASLTSRLDTTVDPRELFRLDLKRASGSILKRKRDVPAVSALSSPPSKPIVLSLGLNPLWSDLASTLADALDTYQRSSSSEKNAALPTESSLFCTIAIQDDASSAAASAPQPSDTTRSSLAVRTANSDVNASGNTGNTGSKDSEDEEAQLSGNTDDGPQSKKARQESVRTSGRTRQKAVVEEPGVKKGLGLLDPNCINRVPASSRQPSKPSKHLSQRMSVSAAGPGVPMPASLVTVPSCFADPKLVQRWLASLPATLTLTELAARLLGDSVLGNATLGIPDALHGRWPSNLAHTLVRILQACEVLRLDVRSAAIASRQHQVDQLDHAAESFHFSLSLAEVMFDQCAAALKSNVSAGASAAGDSKAPGAGNALLDASIPGIFARLFGVIQSASGLLYADKPDLYARGSVTLITSDVVQQLIYEDAANSYMADTQTLLAECQYEQVAQKLVPALKHLERPNELLRLQPLLLNEYVSAVLDDDESADSLFPKILECIRTLSADLQRNAVRVESYASSAQDAASLSETESRDLDAVLLSVKPIAQLLVHVAWQLMVATDGMGTFTSGVVQSKTPDPNASDASAVLRQATGTAAVKAKSQADASSNTDADASDGDNNASDDDDDDDDDDDNESDSTSFSKAADPKSRMVMAMGWIHEQLGEVFLCGADNAAYLRYMMSILSTLEYRKQHVHVNQCYACLYGLIIKLDRETIYEHECPPLPFEKDAATEVFELFSPYILEKLR